MDVHLDLSMTICFGPRDADASGQCDDDVRTASGCCPDGVKMH